MVCILISPSNWQWNGWDEQWLQCTMGTVCLLIQMKLSSHYAIIFWRMSHRYFPIQSARLHFRQNTFRKEKKKWCTALVQHYNNAVELSSFPQNSLHLFISVSACASGPQQPAPWLPSGLFGCCFGFPVGPCFDLGHLYICQGVRRKARAHAFNGSLVSCPLLLQRANHVLHFALPRKEVLHARLQSLNLLPRSLEDTNIVC